MLFNNTKYASMCTISYYRDDQICRPCETGMIAINRIKEIIIQCRLVKQSPEVCASVWQEVLKGRYIYSLSLMRTLRLVRLH